MNRFIKVQVQDIPKYDMHIDLNSVSAYFFGTSSQERFKDCLVVCLTERSIILTPESSKNFLKLLEKENAIAADID